MMVSSAQFLTAGAALSHPDMALWLIRQSSPALRRLGKGIGEIRAA